MSDNMSQLSTSTTRKRIDKHCNECNGKKVTGQQWGPHKKTHGEEKDV
jgi:hypothetical protein